MAHNVVKPCFVFRLQQRLSSPSQAWNTVGRCLQHRRTPSSGECFESTKPRYVRRGSDPHLRNGVVVWAGRWERLEYRTSRFEAVAGKPIWSRRSSAHDDASYISGGDSLLLLGKSGSHMAKENAEGKG